MHEKYSLLVMLGIGFWTSLSTAALAEKVIGTTIAMCVGTVFSFYLRRFLENRKK